jgi:uncharacterized protein YutD
MAVRSILLAMFTVALLIELQIQAAETQKAEAPKLAGLTFVSKDKTEMGNSPAGPVMGNSKLMFTENKVRWRYSDVVESFDYTIEGEGKISATSSMRKKPLEGKFDAAKKELTWDGKIYTLEEKK